MNTKMLLLDEFSLKEAAKLILNGETVAFPTETVYGLGANAFDENAVKKIFAAKGRPSDNPLIVHVANKEQVFSLASCVPDSALKLMDAFMPGPITMVLPKKDCIPSVVTGNMDTVGIRIPSHEGARRFLSACNVPIAAPSANSSGKPSPTSAKHVFDDLNGKIPLILDGGECSGGVESTVISLCSQVPMLLRPGLVTYEQLCTCLGSVDIHPSVLENNKVDKAASPGMKYKHYSPKARVVIANGGFALANELYDAAKECGKNPVIMWDEDELDKVRHSFILMKHCNSFDAARNLFSLLRKADDMGYDFVIVQAVSEKGAGLSVMNRLLRASAFTVIQKETKITAEYIKSITN